MLNRWLSLSPFPFLFPRLCVCTPVKHLFRLRRLLYSNLFILNGMYMAIVRNERAYSHSIYHNKRSKKLKNYTKLQIPPTNYTFLFLSGLFCLLSIFPVGYLTSSCHLAISSEMSTENDYFCFAMHLICQLRCAFICSYIYINSARIWIT